MPSTSATDGPAAPPPEAFAEFDALFRHAPFGVALVDRAFRYVRVNEALAELNGRPVAGHLGRSVREVVPEFADEVEAILRHIFDTGEPAPVIEAPMALPGRPGDVRVMRVRFFPVAEGGAVTHVGAVFADVTDQHRAAETLGAREEQLRQVVESAPNGIVMTDGEGRITLVNRQVERAFGYTREELLGERVEVLIPERFTDRHAGFRAGFLAAPTARPMGAGRDLFGRRKDGSEFPIEIGLTPVETPDGPGVLATVVDITERKRAEAALRESEAEARRLALVAARATNGIVLTNAEGRTEWLNEGFTRLTGYTLDDLHGKRPGDVLQRGDADPATITFIRERVQRREPFAAELLNYRKDGTPFWVRVEATPVFDDAGAPTGYITIQTDVTERRHAEEALRTRERQQAVVAELGHLALRSDGDLQALMDRAVAEVAGVLGVELCKVLELMPDGAHVLLRAGVGWRDGLVGTATVGTGRDSQAGYTLTNEEPVVVEDLRSETRFSGPPLLREHGVVSGMSCIIPGPSGVPWGVLGAHTTSRRAFSRDDVHFLQAVANLLGAALQRQYAESALRASQERYRAFIALSSEGVYRFELEAPLDVEAPAWEQVDLMLYGAYLAECNDAFARMYGYEQAEDLVGTPLASFLSPDDPKTRAFLMGFVEEGYRLAEAETLERDREGNVRVFSNALFGVLRGGRLVRAWGTQRDVTDQRRAEAARRESEATLQLALDVAQIGTWALDLRTNEVTRSASADLLFGFPADGATRTAADFLARVHPDDAESFGAAITRAAGGAGPYQMEYRVRLPSGEVRWLAVRGRVERDAEGTPARHVGAFVDVTARRLAEEALRESEERQRLALEGGGMGTWEWDVESGAVTVDAREAELLGRPPEALRAIAVFFGLVHPDDAAPLREAVEDALAGRAEYAVEFRVVHPDGEVRWLAGRGYVVRGADGRARRMLGLNFDVTDRKRAEEELRRHTREMEQFTYTVSHDLKSPLVTITGFLGLLEAHLDAGRPERVKQSVDRIRKAAGRMSELIDDLLELSRVGRVRGEVGPVDVGALVDEVADGLRRRMAAAGCRLRVRPGLPRVRADARRLSEAFENLLANAAKYACPHGATTVEVRGEVTPEEVRYVVEDDGPGIAPEYHRKIFELFQRLSTDDVEGTGMGLAIVSKIMEVHDGRAWVESEPGGGARFYLAFPRTALVADEAPAAPSPAP